ncbi:hypothetical protein LRP57_05895 [Schaalia sp. lx-260]|nr:hypothetical protein [Schaalia sp. lx-260]
MEADDTRKVLPENMQAEIGISRRARAQAHKKSFIHTTLIRPATAGPMTVTVLSIVAALTSIISNGHWLMLTIPVLAAILLALQWPQLTGTPTSVFGQAGIVFGALVSNVAVSVVKDLYWITLLTALLVVLVLIAEVLSAPRPIDHSQVFSRGESAGTKRISTHVGFSPTWPTQATTATIVASVTGLLIAMSGSTWTGMSVSPRWAFAIPFTAFTVITASWAMRLGSRQWINVLCCFTCTIAAGIGSMMFFAQAVQTSRINAVMHVLSFGAGTSLHVGVVILGVLLGGTVAVVVTVIDRLFAERWASSTSRAAAIGALIFLTATFPIYALIRLG